VYSEISVYKLKEEGLKELEEDIKKMKK